MTRFLAPATVSDMASVAATRPAKRAVARRAAAFRALAAFFSDLQKFQEAVQHSVDSEKRRNTRSRASTAADRSDVKVAGRGVMSGSGPAPPLSARVRLTQSQKVSPGAVSSLLASLGDAEADTVGRLIDVLAKRLSAEFGYGSLRTATAALLFSIERLENSSTMQPLQSLAEGALAGTRGSMASQSRSGGKDLQMLLKPQIEELDRQILAKNLVDVDGLYRARLSGVRVSVRLLKASVLSTRVKAGLLLHQKLSTSPFVVQMFGVGYSTGNGWFVAMEYIERSLEDLIIAWPPMQTSRLVRVAVDVASGFSYLHGAGIFHRDVGPRCVLVTNTLQVKIADFSISEEMSAGCQTLKTLQSTASGVSSPVYTAPEQHINMAVSDSTKMSTEASARCDVYGLGCVLLELFSRSRQRLADALPDDLVHYYSERFKEFKIQTKPGIRAKADAKARGSAHLVPRRERKTPVGIDISDFELPPLVSPAVSSALALDPKDRPSMAVLRDMLSRALREAEAADDENGGILYLDKEQVAEVDRSLVISNLIKGTQNIYKISLFGVTAAVKVMGSVALIGALKSEVKILQETSKHESVVGFLGAGFSQRHGWFLVMEYVPNSLSDLCFRQPLLPLGLRVQMAEDMAGAFRDLHKRGVFHRDIKPHNVLVTSGFQVRICDFGISQTMRHAGQAPGATRREVTIANAGLLGTPAYMSPEQHVGGVDLKRLSPLHTQRIDVFAFGVLLLELFTGLRLSSELNTEKLKSYYRKRSRELGGSSRSKGDVKLEHDAVGVAAPVSVPAFECAAMRKRCDPRLMRIIDICCAMRHEERPLMGKVASLLRRARLDIQTEAKDRAKDAARAPGIAGSIVVATAVAADAEAVSGAMHSAEEKKSGPFSTLGMLPMSPDPETNAAPPAAPRLDKKRSSSFLRESRARTASSGSRASSGGGTTGSEMRLLAADVAGLVNSSRATATTLGASSTDAAVEGGYARVLGNDPDDLNSSTTLDVLESPVASPPTPTARTVKSVRFAGDEAALPLSASARRRHSAPSWGDGDMHIV